MYQRCALALTLLAGLANADNANSAYAAPVASAGYAAPAASYGAPAPSYSAPAPSYSAPAASYGAPAASSSYAAPDAGYGAPSGGYAAAPAYEAPAYDYGYAAPAASGFDPSSLVAFIIPALIIIGLIILAIIVGGFILSILGSSAGLGFLAPFVNFFLNIFGLTLCSVGPPLAIFNGPVVGRMFSEVAETYGYNLTDDQIKVATDLAETAINAIKSHYF